MRRVTIAVVVLTLAGVVGVVMARHASTRTVSLRDVRTASGPTASAPVSERDTAADARSAALAVVASTGRVVRAGLISRGELIGSFTTREFGPKLAASTSAQVSEMLASLGAHGIDAGQLVVLEQPVTATVTTVEGERVRVSVWSVLIVTAPGVGVGRQAWRTVELDMRQVSGRWLVDGWTSTAGPTPALPVEGVVSSASAVADPLGWPPVVVGVG